MARRRTGPRPIVQAESGPLGGTEEGMGEDIHLPFVDKPALACVGDTWDVCQMIVACGNTDRLRRGRAGSGRFERTRRTLLPVPTEAGQALT